MSLYKVLTKALLGDLSGNLLNDLSNDVVFTWVDADQGIKEAFLEGVRFGRLNLSVDVKRLKSENFGDLVIFYESEEEVIKWLETNIENY